MLSTKIFAWVFYDVIPMRIIVWCTLVGSGKEALMPSNEGAEGVSWATAARVVAVATYGRASRWNSYGYGRMCCREEIWGDALKSSLASSALRYEGALGKGVAIMRRVYG